MSPRGEESGTSSPSSPSPPSSPYAILGITPDSDEQSIKKAYRKLALQWHPDKHQEEKDKQRAERKFKRIAQAYEILSDKSRRREFDRQEREPQRRRTRYSHPDNLFRSPFDVFREFFGGRDPFQDIFFDDTYAFSSDPFLFSKHRHPASRVHIFFDERRRPKDENECQFSTVIRFSSASSPGQNASATKTTTTTKVVDGKKIVTKRTEASDKETIEVLENGLLKSRVVNDLSTSALASPAAATSATAPAAQA